MSELESYTRGLILAEGSVRGPSIQISMAAPAKPVLDMIASVFSVNGVRPRKVGPRRQAQYGMTLSGLAEWKKSIKGIEHDRHAVRGYLEGDGSVWWNRVIARGKEYGYPAVSFWILPSQDYIREWLEGFLVESGVEYQRRTKHRPPRVDLWELRIHKKKHATRLMWLLYSGAKVFFKQNVQDLRARTPGRLQND